MKIKIKVITFALAIAMMLATAGCGPEQTLSNESKTGSSSTSAGGDDVFDFEFGDGTTVISGSENSSRASGNNNNTTIGNSNGGNKGNAGVEVGEDNKGDGNTYSTQNRVNNLKGKTIRWGSNWWTPYETNSLAGQKQVAFYRSIEEKLNCKIVWQNVDHATITASLASGKPIVEIVGTLWGINTLYNSARAGQAVNLDSLKVIDFNNSQYSQTAMQGALYKGKHYGVPTPNDGTSAIFLYYDVDILKSAGYTPEQLQKLQDEGKWTWSKFEQVLKDIKKIGKIPCSDLGRTMMKTMFASNGTDVIKSDANGNRKFEIDSNATDAIEKYSSWVDMGLVNTTDEDDTAWMNDNYTKAGFRAGWSQILLEQKSDRPAFNQQTPNWGIIYFPKVDGASNYTAAINAVSHAFIPVGKKNATDAEIATVLDAMMKKFATGSEYKSILSAMYVAKGVSPATPGFKNLININDIAVIPNNFIAQASILADSSSYERFDILLSKIAMNKTTLGTAINQVSSAYNKALANLGK